MDVPVDPMEEIRDVGTGTVHMKQIFNVPRRYQSQRFVVPLKGSTVSNTETESVTRIIPSVTRGRIN